MKRFLVLLALAAPLLARPALAQAGDTATFAPSHLAAVEELLEMMDVEKNMRMGMEMALQEQAAENPEMVAELGDVMREFLAKYLSWADLKPEFVRLYAGSYTEAEVRGLIGFYRTPLGRRVLEVEPTLAARASLIGQRQVQRHTPELVRMIMERQGAGSEPLVPVP